MGCLQVRFDRQGNARGGALPRLGSVGPAKLVRSHRDSCAIGLAEACTITGRPSWQLAARGQIASNEFCKVTAAALGVTLLSVCVVLPQTRMTSRRMTEDMRRISHDFTDSRRVGPAQAISAAQRNKVSNKPLGMVWSQDWCAIHGTHCLLLASQRSAEAVTCHAAVCMACTALGLVSLPCLLHHRNWKSCRPTVHCITMSKNVSLVIQVMPASTTFDALVYLSTIHAVCPDLASICTQFLVAAEQRHDVCSIIVPACQRPSVAVARLECSLAASRDHAMLPPCNSSSSGNQASCMAGLQVDTAPELSYYAMQLHSCAEVSPHSPGMRILPPVWAPQPIGT